MQQIRRMLGDGADVPTFVLVAAEIAANASNASNAPGIGDEEGCAKVLRDCITGSGRNPNSTLCTNSTRARLPWCFGRAVADRLVARHFGSSIGDAMSAVKGWGKTAQLGSANGITSWAASAFASAFAGASTMAASTRASGTATGGNDAILSTAGRRALRAMTVLGTLTGGGQGEEEEEEEEDEETSSRIAIMNTLFGHDKFGMKEATREAGAAMSALLAGVMNATVEGPRSSPVRRGSRRRRRRRLATDSLQAGILPPSNGPVEARLREVGSRVDWREAASWAEEYAARHEQNERHRRRLDWVEDVLTVPRSTFGGYQPEAIHSLSKDDSTVWERAARYLTFNVLLCYLYRPNETAYGGRTDEDSESVLRPTGLHTDHVCFPEMPYDLPRIPQLNFSLLSFLEYHGLDTDEGVANVSTACKPTYYGSGQVFAASLADSVWARSSNAVQSLVLVVRVALLGTDVADLPLRSMSWPCFILHLYELTWFVMWFLLVFFFFYSFRNLIAAVWSLLWSCIVFTTESAGELGELEEASQTGDEGRGDAADPPLADKADVETTTTSDGYRLVGGEAAGTG